MNMKHVQTCMVKGLDLIAFGTECFDKLLALEYVKPRPLLL